ncbi:MAG: glycosyltransferase [Candidatus Nanopelagicales bacterium]
MPLWGYLRQPLRASTMEGARTAVLTLPSSWTGLSAVAHADHVLAADALTASMAVDHGVEWSPELLEGVETVVSSPGAPRPPVLVWAGRMIPRKAPRLALAAWARALPLLPTEAQLVFYGDGPEMQKVRADHRRLGVGTSVRIEGRVPHTNVGLALRSARGLILSSLRDTSSAQILEAAAWGTPVVRPIHSGLRTLDAWYPQDMGWSHLARGSWSAAVIALSKSIVECLSSDEQQWEHRAQLAVRTAERQVWGAKADRVVALYLRLLER